MRASAGYHRWGWRRRCRGTPTSPTSSICSPTSRDRRRRRLPRARLPPRGDADARVRRPVAQLALDGRAKELQGIGRTIEEKIVEIVEDGELQRARPSARRSSRRAWSLFMRLPGLGPKTRAQALAGARDHDVEELRDAAEAQRLRDAAGDRREDARRASCRRSRRRRRAARRAAPRSARPGAAGVEAVVSVLGRIRPATRSRGRQRAPPNARRCATSTSSPPRPTRPR